MWGEKIRKYENTKIPKSTRCEMCVSGSGMRAIVIRINIAIVGGVSVEPADGGC